MATKQAAGPNTDAGCREIADHTGAVFEHDGCCAADVACDSAANRHAAAGELTVVDAHASRLGQREITVDVDRRTVSVPALQVRDGFEYRFQRWEPAQPESFTIVATNIQSTYRAIFVPVRPVTDAKGGALANLRSGRGVALQGLQAAGGPPA